MKPPFDVLDEELRERLERTAFPGWRDPMLATLVREPFSDPDWIFERKLDGVRVLARCRGDDVRLLTRNREVRNDSYPEIAEALAKRARHPAILDGEIVAFEGNVTSFSRLQGRMHLEDPEDARASGIAIVYYVFDLLHLVDRDVRRLPLRARKRLLREAVDFEDPIRYTEHRNARGRAYLEEACRRGWEGLIAKEAGSPYTGSRSRRWLKLKCSARQEFVIGGFTDPRRSRPGLGALLLGVHEGEELHYAGKVGTGFDHETLRALRARLDRLERGTPPFADDPGDLPDEAHWVTPKLVCEVAFTEWTGEGKLRHPRYQGLRRDKDPGDVHRERAEREAS